MIKRLIDMILGKTTVEIPAHMKIAMSQIGQAEIDGEKHNERILEYISRTTIRPLTDEIPWCAAFVNWVVEEAGYRGTKSALARSFLEWGRILRRGNMRHGDILIFKRGTKSWQGHVAFFVCDIGHSAVVLGGNQANSVCYRAYPWSDLLGIVRPCQKML